jgi:hypothetical protein
MFEVLQRAGLLKRSAPNPRALMNMPFTRLLEVLDEASASTARRPTSASKSTQIHCASLGLGGGRAECEGLSCRATRLDELSRFAALYADRVVIHNFIAELSPTFGHPPPGESDEFREMVFADLTLLATIRPLVEQGLIVPFTPPSNVCPSCLAESAFGIAARRRLRRAERNLSREIGRNISVRCGKGESRYMVTFSGPERFLPHRGMRIVSLDPWPGTDTRRILRRLEAGETVLVSSPARPRTEAVTTVADGILSSVDYQLAVAGVVDGSFLTHRDIDLDVLRYVSGSPDLARRNELAASHLEMLVPFLSDVPISDLLTLRKKEGDAFIRFRAALKQAVEEFKSAGPSFTAKDAKTLHADFIAPELSRLNQKVAEAKRDVLKIPMSSAVGTVAAIGFGLYTGLIPAELRIAAEALGITKIVSDAVGKIVEKSDIRATVRPEQFYYLWKVQQASRKRRNGTILF